MIADLAYVISMTLFILLPLSLVLGWLHVHEGWRWPWEGTE